MLKLDLSNKVRAFISSRQPKHQRQIVAKIRDLRGDPHPSDSKLLKGKARDFKRASIGEYRIVYRVENDVLYVAAVGKCNDDEVYRLLSRKKAE